MTLRKFFQQQRSEWPLAKKNYDDLEGVKTHELQMSTGAKITVQCNPARIVSTAAKIDKAALAKRPCFLCEKNRPQEQMSLPPFSGEKAKAWNFEVLINPFPILPEHYTMPSTKHELQQIKPYFPAMLDFLDATTTEGKCDYAIFYNGPRSGASAPDHMHFQIGRVADIPYYDVALQSAVKGEKYTAGTWPGANISIINKEKEAVVSEFYSIYEALPVPTGEFEPMMNVFARKNGEDYEVTLFLRSQHRPACYGTRLVSPGALDMVGLLITPRLEDYEEISAKEAESIYNEVSEPGILDILNYNLQQEGRKIAVGLIETEGEIKYSFNGEHKEVHILNDTYFVPTTDECSFTIENIIIGVNFHWQQERELTYKGILKLTKAPDGKNVAINILTVEDYLKSVISSEMSAMSDFELLKAHAILSRSWLIANIEGVHNEKCEDEEGLKWYDRSAHTIYDVCADDHCQRYQGITMQTSPLVEKAIDATRGKVLMYEGKVCDARFSKCCGGKSEEYEYCWDNNHYAYLESVDCPYCNTTEQFDSKEEEQKVLGQVLNDYDLETRNFYNWTATYKNPDLKEIIPLERGKSGRLWKVKFVYNDGREEIVGKELEIRRRLSDSHLYSSWFTSADAILPSSDGTFTIAGRGWGHGVGLCQIGAAVMAAKGFKYDEILKHYFPKAEIK